MGARPCIESSLIWASRTRLSARSNIPIGRRLTAPLTPRLTAPLTARYALDVCEWAKPSVSFARHLSNARPALSAACMSVIQDFAGRSALVTGAASGIGAACAKALAARGATKLFLNDVNAEGIEALDLGSACEVVPVIGSVADEALWTDLEPRLTGIDHAIVNAGIGAGGPIADLSFSEWRRIMDVNLDGAFLTLRTALRAMKSNTSPTGASVVITASSTGVKPVPGVGPYGTSKAAVAHMARIAAMENASNQIRVNAIAPGGVDTAIWESGADFNRSVEAIGREETFARMAKTTPLERFASSDEIADTMLYLLNDPNITGHVLVSDGGFTL